MFLVQSDRGCRDLTGEFVWRPVGQGPVRAALIVFPSPGLDDLFLLLDRSQFSRMWFMST